MRLLLQNVRRAALAAVIAALAIQVFAGSIAKAAGDISSETAAASSPAASSNPVNIPSNPASAADAKASAAAQAKDPAPVRDTLHALLHSELFNSGTDPSNPVNQFSVRNYYFNYRNGEFRNNMVFRVEEKARPRLELAAELTLAMAHRKDRSYYGTGDSYFQALYTPWKTSHFGITIGTGMVFPTGSSSMLGSGKWQLAPILIPLFYPLGDGTLLTYLELRNFVSVASVGHFNFVSAAGDAPFKEAAGAQINYLEMRPVVRYTLSDQWYLYAEPLFTTLDWEQGGRPSYRSALRLGHMFNARIGAWVQPEVPFGPDRTGDFNLKLSLFIRY